MLRLDVVQLFRGAEQASLLGLVADDSGVVSQRASAPCSVVSRRVALA
jgi:hypothetical protein